MKTQRVTYLNMPPDLKEKAMKIQKHRGYPSLSYYLRKLVEADVKKFGKKFPA